MYIKHSSSPFVFGNLLNVIFTEISMIKVFHVIIILITWHNERVNFGIFKWPLTIIKGHYEKNRFRLNYYNSKTDTLYYCFVLSLFMAILTLCASKLLFALQSHVCKNWACIWNLWNYGNYFHLTKASNFPFTSDDRYELFPSNENMLFIPLAFSQFPSFIITLRPAHQPIKAPIGQMRIRSCHYGFSHLTWMQIFR